ncbi:MAG TPA: hypothetical protein VHZ55_04925 [Bryobacteraceae bacterium]|nr:hypothetical protein [Bryobacteraceae bacterium]
MLLPIPALLNAVVGILSLLLFGASLPLLAHAYRRYRQLLPQLQIQQVPVRERTAGGIAVEKYDNHAFHEWAWRRALADKSVSVPLTAGVGLLLFTLFGADLVRLSFRRGRTNPNNFNRPILELRAALAGRTYM